MSRPTFRNFDISPWTHLRWWKPAYFEMKEGLRRLQSQIGFEFCVDKGVEYIWKMLSQPSLLEQLSPLTKVER